MISAIAKRRLALRKEDGSFITVKPGEFVSLPEEVKHDPMYTWAVKDGLLVVSQQVIAPVETNVAKTEPVEPQPVEPQPGADDPKPDSGKGKGKDKGKGKGEADK